jgi:hypothetical protein
VDDIPEQEDGASSHFCPLLEGDRQAFHFCR